jgi:hypothetical protein
MIQNWYSRLPYRQSQKGQQASMNRILAKYKQQCGATLTAPQTGALEKAISRQDYTEEEILAIIMRARGHHRVAGVAGSQRRASFRPPRWHGGSDPRATERSTRRPAGLQKLPTADDPHLYGQAWTEISLLRMPDSPAEGMEFVSHQIGASPHDRRFGSRTIDPPDAPAPAPRLSALRLMLRSTSRGAGGANAQVQDDGAFQIQAQLLSDTYRLELSGIPDGYYLKTVKLGGQPIPDAIFDFSSGGPTDGRVELVLAPPSGVLAGSVNNSKGG